MARNSALLTALVVVLPAACGAAGPGPHEPGSTQPAPARPAKPDNVEKATMFSGARRPGGVRIDLMVTDGFVVSSTASTTSSVDLSGRWIVPAFIDSHVHLSYLPVADQLAAGGIVAAIDLAAPMAALSDSVPLQVLRSGPILTAPRGYPTQGWGRDGYGLEVDGPTSARAAVVQLHAAGARLIKLAVVGRPTLGRPALDDQTLAAAVEQAHALGLRTAAHALTDIAAMRAAAAGIDALAHTPVEPLSDETVAAWSKRVVVATLTAFGATPDTVDNLRRLRAAGATVLYGTDLGNTRTPSIDAREVAAMVEAGLNGEDIIAAATRDSAQFWGLPSLGALSPGVEASFLVLDRDPLADPSALSEPVAVYIAGVRVR